MYGQGYELLRGWRESDLSYFLFYFFYLQPSQLSQVCVGERCVREREREICSRLFTFISCAEMSCYFAS